MVAVSYDSVEVLKRFAIRGKITYPLLSDAGSQTIKAYGIYNQDADGGKLQGIPHPGTFIIDQEGVIRAKLFYDGYRERHQSQDMIQAGEALKEK